MAERIFDINIPLHDLAEGRSVRVIDVGCGFGDVLIYLQSRGCEVLGTEYDVSAQVAGTEYGVPILIGALHDLALPDQRFDVAILQHSLEHLADPKATLAELARIVRPGGRIHIAVPNGNSAGLVFERERWSHLSHPLHLWYFDRLSLEAILATYGFEILRVRFRTPWQTYRQLWLDRVSDGGLRGALAFFLRLGAYRMSHREGGDIFNVVAQKPDDRVHPA